jgi:hypothetical protein
MSVIIGVEPTPVEPKPTTKKCRGRPKDSGKTNKKLKLCKNWCDVMLCYLYFDS